MERVGDRIEPDLLSVLKTVAPAFEAVPSPFDPRRTLRYAIRGGSEERFVVDVLAPMRGPPRDRPVHLPAPEGDVQPLPVLDFLLYEEIEALVLHGTGIPVKAPAPERFAVHKLLVAARRRTNTTSRTKARKDLQLAALLVRVLATDRPEELRDAWGKCARADQPGARRRIGGGRACRPTCKTFCHCRTSRPRPGTTSPARRRRQGDRRAPAQATGTRRYPYPRLSTIRRIRRIRSGHDARKLGVTRPARFGPMTSSGPSTSGLSMSRGLDLWGGWRSAGSAGARMRIHDRDARKSGTNPSSYLCKRTLSCGTHVCVPQEPPAKLP